MPKTAKDYLDCASRLETEQMFWRPQWQLVCEYIHQRRADFTTSRQPGAFISSEIWNDDAVHMAETSASAFLGYMWASGAKSFKLSGNDTVFGKDPEMKDFWNEATAMLQEEMDDQEAGLSVALDEAMLDLIVIGTAGVFIEERNVDKPLLGAFQFEPWSVLEFCLDENAIGRADSFYRRRQFTVRQMAEKYGIEKCSKKVRDAYLEQKYDDRIDVLHVIEPRLEKDRKAGSKAAKDMPIASVHIEIATKHFCKNSGYPELPVACARLAKRIRETYGRGRGMNALPSIMMLNQVTEDYMLAMEKKLDPSMYVLNETVAGNGVIDTSAGSINVLRINKANPNLPPAGKLFDIQDTNQVAEVMEKLVETISNHFMIDRLINMNNDREMTAREALIRNAIRQSTLRSIVSRLLLELFEPLIDTAFMILLRRGKFGYMPNDKRTIPLQRAGKTVKMLPDKLIQAINDGENLYTIEYSTPAARDRMAEEGQGMMETLEIAGSMAAWDETIPTYIDKEWTLNRFSEVRGASPQMFRKKSEVKKDLEKIEAAKTEAQNAGVGAAVAGAAKDMAGAAQMG